MTEPTYDLATTDVRLTVSNELLDELERWTQPVRVKIVQDQTEPTGWTMIIKTIGVDDNDLADLYTIRDLAQQLADKLTGL